MKTKRIVLTGLLTIASVLCLVSCKNVSEGRSEAEKQAITASMEAGMDQGMFQMSLGHNVVVLKLNHPKVSEFMAVQEQYIEDFSAWEKDRKKHNEEPEPARPENFICISLISDMDAAEYTRLKFTADALGRKEKENAYLSYINEDDDYFSKGTKGETVGLEYRYAGDSLRIVLRSPGYTTKQLENMQVLIETEEGILGADATPNMDYDVPDDVTDCVWRMECEKELSDFEHAEHLKNTTDDYRLVEDSRRAKNPQRVGMGTDYYDVLMAYYYDESGALVDADCLHYYKTTPADYANLYVGEDRNIGGVTGLYRSQEDIEQMLEGGKPKQHYLVYLLDDRISSYDTHYFSNPTLTSEQICNYGELGY